MERREKRDKWQEIKYGRVRKTLHNLWTWCCPVTLSSVASFDSLLDHSENVSTRKGFKLPKNLFFLLLLYPDNF